nr:odorant receptor 10 [Achelura yunnanensis]
MFENVKRFGLGHCDLPTMLWNVTVTLKLLAVNIDRNCRRVPIVCYVFAGYIGCSYFYVYGVSNTWFVLWRCRETGELITATIFFSLQVASEIGLAKLLFMFYHKNKILDIIDQYITCDQTIKPRTKMSNTLIKYLRSVKKRALIFWFIIIGNGIGYITKPLMLPGKHFIEDNQVFLGLEPLYESPYYEIAYILTAGGIAFTCYSPANITAFYIVLSGYTEAQLLALSEGLMSLWGDAQQYCNNRRSKKIEVNKYVRVYKLENDKIKNEIINDFVKKRLNKIINYHVININLIRQIEEVSKGCIAVEFGLLMAALVAELLGGLENTYMELPFSLLLVSMDCLMGQKLIDASETFTGAVYGCGWENFDVNNMKTILTLLINSQKSLTLSAGGIRVLNFMCLGSVIKSIFSAFTTLRSVLM